MLSNEDKHKALAFLLEEGFSNHIQDFEEANSNGEANVVTEKELKSLNKLSRALKTLHDNITNLLTIEDINEFLYQYGQAIDMDDTRENVIKNTKEYLEDIIGNSIE